MNTTIENLVQSEKMGLVKSDGTRTALGGLLALVARSDSLEVERRKVDGLIRFGLVNYGLHPAGSSRASITSKGRDVLANI